jgi:hypothetical protein
MTTGRLLLWTAIALLLVCAWTAFLYGHGGSVTQIQHHSGHAGAGNESTDVKVMSANGFSRFIVKFGLAFRSALRLD